MRFDLLIAAALATVEFTSADLLLDRRGTDLVVRDGAHTYDILAREPGDHFDQILDTRGLGSALTGTNADALYKVCATAGGLAYAGCRIASNGPTFCDIAIGVVAAANVGESAVKCKKAYDEWKAKQKPKTDPESHAMTPVAPPPTVPSPPTPPPPAPKVDQGTQTPKDQGTQATPKQDQGTQTVETKDQSVQTKPKTKDASTQTKQKVKNDKRDIEEDYSVLSRRHARAFVA